MQAKLKHNLDGVQQWCKLNNMLLHPDKTKCMVLCTKQRNFKSKELTLRISNQVIQNVKVQKLLGVYNDNTLSWNDKIEAVCNKLNSKIALLRRISYFLTDEMKRLFYNAYIMPIFDYCCTVWCHGTATSLKKIMKIQGRAGRIILNKTFQTRTMDILRELGWMSFNERCKFHTGCLIYKACNNLAPSYIYDMLTFSSNETYNLRSAANNDIVIPKHRTNYGKKTFCYSSAYIWNSIPIDIRSTCSLMHFKNKYKQHILQLTA